jgi:hypothetical protein
MMTIALLADQSALAEAAMRSGEVRDIDLDVVAVIRQQRGVGLAVDELLRRTEARWRRACQFRHCH